MSEDDDNDRMNRADRLREMREGRRRGRGGDEDDEPDADDSTADDAADDAEDVSVDDAADEAESDDDSGASRADALATERDDGTDELETEDAAADDGDSGASRADALATERDDSAADADDESDADDSGAGRADALATERDDTTADADAGATAAEDDGDDIENEDASRAEALATERDDSASEAETAAASSEPMDQQDTETATASEGNDTSTDDSAAESGFEFDESDEGQKTQAHDEKAEKPAAAGEASTTPQSGIAQQVSSGDAMSAVERLNSGQTFGIPEQATTVTEADEQAAIEGAEQSVAAARAAAASRGTTHVGARTRVLEFELGDERFCLDIDYIEEIVELENMTRVPNSPSYVEGVVDLRGQVTTIINPKDALDVEQDGKGELIIVFDSEEVGDQGHLGWVVDEVQQVTPVSDEEVNDSPDEEAEHINGIINRDDEEDFVVWTTPELALGSTDDSGQNVSQSNS